MTERHGRARSALHRRRAAIRANPVLDTTYRVAVALVGLVVVALGLVLVPFPGPGWAIVFVGVFVWATEFGWARRLHDWGMGHLRRWNAWIMAQAVWVRMLVGLATAAFVGLVLLVTVWLNGLPGWLPDAVVGPLREHLPAAPWS